MQNQTNSAITVSGGASQVAFGPCGLLMHPGKNGECAVIRFTAPYNGQYRVARRFCAMDSYGSGTNIKASVMVNGSPNAGGLVKAGWPQHHSFNLGTKLTVGQTVDFAADMNGGHVYDSTGLHALVALQ